MISWVLFLDDTRHPMDAITGEQLQRYHSDGHVVLWAKNIEQAKWYVENYDLPVFMHLDHDLGMSGGEEGPKWSPHREITTMDFLNWLHYDMNLIRQYPCLGYMIHSANPEGQKSIMAFMSSWHKVHNCSDCDGNGCNNCTKATEDN